MYSFTQYMLLNVFCVRYRVDPRNKKTKNKKHYILCTKKSVSSLTINRMLC